MKRTHALIMSVCLSTLLLSTTGVNVRAAEAEKPLFPIYSQFKYGFIDQTGQVVIPAKFLSVESFHDGLAVASVARNKYGYIDSKGVFVLPAIYDRAKSFQDGIAKVSVGDETFYIDKTGKKLWSTPLDATTEDFREGVAALQTEDGKWGYVNREGKMVIPATFEYASGFSEGLAVVTMANGKYGYIDKTGKLVIAANYDYADAFEDGLALVMVNGKSGYINKTGAFVIKADFDYASAFNSGLAFVQKGGKYGVINTKGEYVLKPEFDESGVIDHGKIYIGGKVLDPSGKQLLQVQGTIHPFENGLAVVEDDQRYSFVDQTGKVVWKENRDFPLDAKVSVIEKKRKLDQFESLIYYPELTGLANKPVQDKINAALKNDFFADYQGDPEATLNADYEVMYHKQDVLNLMGYFYEYPLGAAHGMPGRTSVILNLANGNVYHLKDLFKPGSGYKEKINKIIKEQFAKKQDDLLGEFETIDDNVSFYLEDDGFVIYFSPYEYTPYAAGFPEFAISYETMKDYINVQGELWRSFHQ